MQIRTHVRVTCRASLQCCLRCPGPRAPRRVGLPRQSSAFRHGLISSTNGMAGGGCCADGATLLCSVPSGTLGRAQPCPCKNHVCRVLAQTRKPVAPRHFGRGQNHHRAGPAAGKVVRQGRLLWEVTSGVLKLWHTSGARM